MTRDVQRAAAAAIAAYAAMSHRVEVGPASVLLCPEVAPSPMLNRVVGLGLDRLPTDAEVDAALSAVPAGTTYYVSVEPGPHAEAIGTMLARRGLEPGWGWMRFTRGVDAPPAVTSDLRLQRAETPDQVDVFARVVGAAFGLPPTAAAILHRAASSWELWLALDGDEPAGAAALFAHEGVGYLGIAGTVAEHRGKGAQSLLLRHRIVRAGELGCDLVASETGERREGSPSDSYRNLLRAGLRETSVLANWLGRA